MANLREPDTLAIQNKPDELQEEPSRSSDSKAKRDAAADPDTPRSDAERRRGAASTQQVSMNYKPQTEATRAAYEALLSVIQHQLGLGGQPLDVLAGAAHQPLAILKNDKLNNPADKKKAIDQLLRSTIPYQLFHHLVFIGSFITDFHDAAHGDAAGAPSGNAVDTTTLDDDVIVSADFEDKGQYQDTGFHQFDDDDVEFVLSINPVDDYILYKPQTKETRAAYKALLNVVLQHLSCGNLHHVIAWFTDKVLATLKNDKLNSTSKKKDIEEKWFHHTISSQLFGQLVSIANLITDHPDVAAADAAGLKGSDGSKTSRSKGAVADTSSSSESVNQDKIGKVQILSMKRQKIQILREMLDLQKRDMEWRKKQHEENISFKKKEMELSEKQVEAQLITAEAGIMVIYLEKVAPYMKSYYIGMQQQIMERRGFSSAPNS